MADPLNDPFESFVSQIKKGSTPLIKQDSSIIVDDKEPSAIGGLAALGATALGTGLIARRIPGVRAFLQKTKEKPNMSYTPTKTVEEIPNVPTATGQSTELITTAPVPAVSKSKFGDVINIPFTQGKGYSSSTRPGMNLNPIVGSSTYDRIMEAPFEKAPANEWIEWLTKGMNPQLKVNTGPLTGVSRRVTPDELDELNIVTLKKGLKAKPMRDIPGQQPGRQKYQEVVEPTGGFLKAAKDNKIEVDRDTLLSMVRNSPINDLKTIRLGVRGNPDGEMVAFKKEVNDTVMKYKPDGVPEGNFINDNLDAVSKVMFVQNEPVKTAVIQRVQKNLADLGTEVGDSKPFADLLVKFNKLTGNYNNYSQKIKRPDGFSLRRDKQDGFYPAYKTGMGYNYKLDGGENFTEDVIYYGKNVPNTRTGKFYEVDSPHYIDNEIGFIRYDDLPNPKLGPGKRHIRVSEVQSDLHSPQFSSSQSTRDDYFKKKINTFNLDAPLKILRKQRQELLDKIAPYEELGRGVAGLTRKQQQELARVNYEIGRLEKSGMGQLMNQGLVNDTTAGPLSRAWPDYAVKSLLRTMAERDINAISIVPSPMNKGVKMPDFSKSGDEINYGLMDGKALIRNKEGKFEKTNKFATMVEPLNRLAKQYGAKFEMFPMPKSNPEKPFKVIRVVSSKDLDSFERAVRTGKAHYNKKIGNEYVFEDHLAAADTLEEAENLLNLRKSEVRGVSAGRLIIKELGPNNPDVYEMVPTLIADSATLKKFLLPMKAYMKVGGFVDKTNIFKGLL
jgi:hypothetical protein|tara:strand:+ start:989 stop:3337 length:2349 start_codon:yes stop_codon:yes gene_type:complete